MGRYGTFYIKARRCPKGICVFGVLAVALFLPAGWIESHAIYTCMEEGHDQRESRDAGCEEIRAAVNF